MSIDIAINPNTKIPSVAIRMTGYFGLDQDGLKLVDSDVVFKESTTPVVARIPSGAFETIQLMAPNNGGITGKDPKNGRFVLGNNLATGRPKGSRNKNSQPLIELMKEVADNKHYEIKGTGEKVVGIKLIAEKVVDKAVQGELKYIEFFADRTEGKPKQTIAFATGDTQDDESINRLKELFPNDFAPKAKPTETPNPPVTQPTEPTAPTTAYEPKA